MELLTIDVGNTSVDLCLWEGSRLVLWKKVSHDQIPKLSVDRVLVSSVKPSLRDKILELYPGAVFLSHEHVPMEVCLPEREKVGIDRLLNCYGAVKLYGRDLVVVSVGTALVVDLCLEGKFWGGFVVLGMKSSLECLHQRAELIPLLELKKMDVLIGKDTQSAILGGLLRQGRAFILECKRAWEEHYKRELRLILTGGDGWLFEELGVYEPLLLHKAMLSLAQAFYSSP